MTDMTAIGGLDADPDPDRRLSAGATDVVNALVPLPLEVQATSAFMARIPSQRTLDELKRLEPDLNFGELLENQSPRLIAFRALLRDFPERDITSLWLHAYDVEIELIEVDPTNGQSPMLSPPSAPTTA